MSEYRWLEQENQGHYEPHTPENASERCKPDCVGHYIFQRVFLPVHTTLRTLKDAE